MISTGDKIQSFLFAYEKAKASGNFSIEDENRFLNNGIKLIHEAHADAVKIASEYIDAFKTQKDEFQKLVDKYKALQADHEKEIEYLFTSFSLDPSGTMELLLKKVERQHKIEDQSGGAWKWSYKMPLWFRLETALRLILKAPLFMGKYREKEQEG